MNIERIAAPPADRQSLGALALSCIQHRLHPDILDMMADQYRQAAAEIRAAGLSRMEGRA